KDAVQGLKAGAAQYHRGLLTGPAKERVERVRRGEMPKDVFEKDGKSVVGSESERLRLYLVREEANNNLENVMVAYGDVSNVKMIKKKDEPPVAVALDPKTL